MQVLVAVLATLGVIVTGVASWLVARRSTSGSVRTSEATSLWTESQAIRQELREEARLLRHDLVNTRMSLDLVRAESIACREEGVKMAAQIAALEKQINERG